MIGFSLYGPGCRPISMLNRLVVITFCRIQRPFIGAAVEFEFEFELGRRIRAARRSRKFSTLVWERRPRM